MASLNTLRTRGALILTIFIGVALLAFLLQDLTSASSVFQRGRTRIGSINGTNIDYMEFLNTGDGLQQVIQDISGRSSLSAAEQDQIREMTWQTYIRRYAYNPGFRRLGLTVGEGEQIDMVQGQYVSPVITSLFSSPQTGLVDKGALSNFVASLENDVTGRMPAMWNYAKEEMTSERTVSKFVSLVGAGTFVNDLEVAQGVAAANNSYNGGYALLPFSTIADSLITVSSAEVKKYFNEHKNNFKQTASRDIEYVMFERSPSEADYADAATHIEAVASEFAAAEDPMQYAIRNSQERTDPSYYSESRLPAEIAAIAFGNNRGGMAGPTLTGNVYTISRISDERMMPDSVGARHILLQGTRIAAADSLVGAIRGGASILDLGAEYTVPGQAVDLGVFPPEMMVEPFADALIAVRPGDVFTVDTQFGTHVVEMTYKSPSSRKVQIATVTYNVEPSSATEQAAYNGARDFLAAAAGSKEKFDEAVASTGAARRVATINQRDREITGMTDSRELLRWSFNTKPGTVSPIFDVDGDYVVAVITDAKESGIANVTDAAPTIVSRLRTEKKAAMLSEQMAGKSIAEIAGMEGARSGELTALKTNTTYNPELGLEPAVMGAFEGLQAGQTSKPIEGISGMHVVSVSSIDTIEDVTSDSERVRLEATAEASAMQRVQTALEEESDIQDHRARFL